MNYPMSPRMVLAVQAAVIMTAALLMIVALLSYQTMRTTARTEALSGQTVTELRSLNQLWRDLVTEQRQRNDSLRARTDSLVRDTFR